MSRLTDAIEQLVFARSYTHRLLEHTPVHDWFRQTPGGISHVGWQVGHLAVAEYRLTQARIRGERPEDATVIDPKLIELFAWNSVPSFDAARYPSPTEIRAFLDRVHVQALRELATLPESEWDQPLLNPHPRAKTKLWSIFWCAHHEMLHGGQIGLIRRQLGYSPIS